jgi:hypothetical protein
MDVPRTPKLKLVISPNGCPCATLPAANRAAGNVGGARAAARGAPSPTHNQVKRMLITQ